MVPWTRVDNLGRSTHTEPVTWRVELDPSFRTEYLALPEAVQDGMASQLTKLRQQGPSLGRPTVDTLHGSRYANMKELRFAADRGAWRVAFAFDPERRAIVLVAGDKRGQNEQRFYRRLIRQADERYTAHLSAQRRSGT